MRYGVIHRNTFLNSPKILTSTYCLKTNPNIFFAGQITGVEGYVESIMSGLISAINLHQHIIGANEFVPPVTTICGALQRHISRENVNFQPMNSNFGILPELDEKIRDKKLRKTAYSLRAEADMKTYIEKNLI